MTTDVRQIINVISALDAGVDTLAKENKELYDENCNLRNKVDSYRIGKSSTEIEHQELSDLIQRITTKFKKVDIHTSVDRRQKRSRV